MWMAGPVFGPRRQPRHVSRHRRPGSQVNSHISFLSQEQIAELCQMATWSDREVRGDLAGGFIRNEDDYTSNFTGAFRRNINAYSQTGLVASSFMASTGVERRTGCDAAIVISRGGRSKVALFEAKWPRFQKTSYPWDYAQTATGLSHFSDQLERQKAVHPDFAVFEMFYNEYPFGTQPDPLHEYLSSCVWHSDAVSFNEERASATDRWTTGDLRSLIKGDGCTIVEILQSLGLCLEGVPLALDGTTEGVAGELGIEGPVLRIDAREDVNG